MEIKMVERHTEVPENVKAMALKKVEKLGKYSSRIRRIDAIIEQQKFLFNVEILVAGDYFKINAIGQNNDLLSCFDDVLSKAQRQLRKYKTRKIDKKHGKGRAVSPEAEALEEE
ncbi:MAG TPA: ribosome-associated translation inhibitor RaiA [Candidatus Sumerlaeota bacterium]|nr:ribosome-associated translation inhibitor RaiA [Candidatus Sumerlaeota bacterium]